MKEWIMVSLWRQWWQNRQAQARQRRRRGPGVRARPCVEALEDRTLLSTFPSPVFTSAGSTYAGLGPFAVAVGNFDRDGNPDLAVLNVNSDTVSVLLGNGHGGFGTASSLQVGFTPVALAAADFTQDGILDLVVLNNGGSSVSLLRGLGDGTFAPAVDFRAGTKPIRLAVGDFDGDSLPDLAVIGSANADGPSTSVIVLLNDGAGGFRSPTPFSIGREPSAVAVGDFNGDGKLDIVTANTSTDGNISRNSLNILLGDGQGAFTGVGGGASPFTLPIATHVHVIVVGDFNGDGIQDIATANLVGTVSVRLGTGTVSFQPPVTVDVGQSAVSLAMADFNGDGKQDLVTANSASNNVSVLLGDGAGGFSAPINVNVGHVPVQVAVGDFNGDGRPDLVVVNNGDNNVTVLLNRRGQLSQFQPQFARDILGLFRIGRRFRNANHGHARVMLRLTNTSGENVQGPLFLVVGRLPRHVRLLHPSGMTALGSPFVELGPGGGNIYNAGDTLVVALDFAGLHGRHPHFALDLFAGALGQAAIDHTIFDVTSLVRISPGGLASYGLGHFRQAVTLVNTSGSPIAGPLTLVLDGLSPGFHFVRTGLTAVHKPLGSPFKTFRFGEGFGLIPGLKLIVFLDFSDFIPRNGQHPEYVPRLLAGDGTP
jgi:hypothetical protein